jgi:hypothetical protein
MMGTTPDRRPGPLIEDEEIRLEANVTPPTQNGAFNYDGTSFQMRDAVGIFDPRAGTGITESQHEALDTLVHDIDETSYDEVTYSGSDVTFYIVWTSVAKTRKVREEQYTYGTGHRVSQAVTIQYDAAGAVKMTMTETYTYNSSRVDTVTRTKTGSP